MDKLTPGQRSKIMASVGQKNTSPEIKVRKLLHSLGYRFRLHQKDLPGKPDIVLPRYRLCIFVHGCFWHQHRNCTRANIPTTNQEFWLEKFQKNRDRDIRVRASLEESGWRVAVVWECSTKSVDELLPKIEEIFHESNTCHS
ncbi:very short patch repair endonuclease [Herbaspirillum huttiense]|uniref:very short patch repair endonuclease n=1 Tax=Herbaspirillum huttiense TaxID=863372 RepID=UPI0039B0ACC0